MSFRCVRCAFLCRARGLCVPRHCIRYVYAGIGTAGDRHVTDPGRAEVRGNRASCCCCRRCLAIAAVSAFDARYIAVT